MNFLGSCFLVIMIIITVYTSIDIIDSEEDGGGYNTISTNFIGVTRLG